MKTIAVLLLLAGLTGCSTTDKTSPEADSLSQGCLEALAPVEEYMSKRTEPLDDISRAELRTLLEKPYDYCSRKEFAIYRDGVIVPWATGLGDK